MSDPVGLGDGAKAASARLSAVLNRSLRHWRPPKRLRLSEWADENYYLSAESSAQSGRWKTIPYQRGVMDAITDPRVERVSWMKCARVGATKLMNATVGYYIDQDPCPIMVVQPTLEDAEGYSKEEIAPMLRDCPRLALLVPEARSKNSNNTLRHKKYPGGVLSMVGANSPGGFRRVSRKVLLCDEIDGYPQSAGTEGDPISLAIRRTEFYWDRKIYVASTPGTAGRSRIAEMFEAGDQRRYFVPCPACEHMDFLVFNQGEAGHYMVFDSDAPLEDVRRDAHFVCSRCGVVIEHKDKRRMIERGEWRAQAPFTGHASFHIWAAYSYSPNATWGDLACEFIEAKKGGPDKLKTFVNTALGETWQDRGDAPDWLRLYQRRESYPIGTVPDGVLLVTAGVDVQRDRLVWEAVGWGVNKQSWSIDNGVLVGDTSAEEVWTKLDGLLEHSWPGANGSNWSIQGMGIDSGYNTNTVYNWARRHPGRVFAVKGSATADALIGKSTSVEVTVRGKRRRGCKLWVVGVGIAKTELYGWLRQDPPTSEGGEWPHGYCHHPMYGEEYFKQLTSEHHVQHTKRDGRTVFEWQVLAGRENHILDCRVYARAIAQVLGLDRHSARARAATAAKAPPVPPTAPAVAPAVRPEPAAPAAPALPPHAPAPARPPPQRLAPEGWLSGKSGGRGNWLGTRR